jgi:hypothetical protein
MVIASEESLAEWMVQFLMELKSEVRWGMTKERTLEVEMGIEMLGIELEFRKVESFSDMRTDGC